MRFLSKLCRLKYFTAQWRFAGNDLFFHFSFVSKVCDGVKRKIEPGSDLRLSPTSHRGEAPGQDLRYSHYGKTGVTSETTHTNIRDGALWRCDCNSRENCDSQLQSNRSGKQVGFSKLWMRSY